MKMKQVTTCALAAVVAIAPFSPADAHGWHGGHDAVWPIVGIAALGTALVVGTAEILTAPVRAVAAVSPPAPAPYYAPQPAAYYGQPPVYYQQPPVVYSQPPVYYQSYYYR